MFAAVYPVKEMKYSSHTLVRLLELYRLVFLSSSSSGHLFLKSTLSELVFTQFISSVTPKQNSFRNFRLEWTNTHFYG